MWHWNYWDVGWAGSVLAQIHWNQNQYWPVLWIWNRTGIGWFRFLETRKRNLKHRFQFWVLRFTLVTPIPFKKWQIYPHSLQKLHSVHIHTHILVPIGSCRGGAETRIRISRFLISWTETYSWGSVLDRNRSRNQNRNLGLHTPECIILVLTIIGLLCLFLAHG